MAAFPLVAGCVFVCFVRLMLLPHGMAAMLDFYPWLPLPHGGGAILDIWSVAWLWFCGRHFGFLVSCMPLPHGGGAILDFLAADRLRLCSRHLGFFVGLFFWAGLRRPVLFFAGTYLVY